MVVKEGMGSGMRDWEWVGGDKGREGGGGVIKLADDDQEMVLLPPYRAKLSFDLV